MHIVICSFVVYTCFNGVWFHWCFRLLSAHCLPVFQYFPLRFAYELSCIPYFSLLYFTRTRHREIERSRWLLSYLVVCFTLLYLYMDSSSGDRTIQMTSFLPCCLLFALLYLDLSSGDRTIQMTSFLPSCRSVALPHITLLYMKLVIRRLNDPDDFFLAILSFSSFASHYFTLHETCHQEIEWSRWLLSCHLVVQ